LPFFSRKTIDNRRFQATADPVEHWRCTIIKHSLVPFTLSHPDSIFGGLRPPDDKYSGESPGWLCYCSRPVNDFTATGDVCNPQPNKVFVVFVNEDGLIFNWRWENADIDAFYNKEYLPKNYQTRFQRRYL